MMAKKTPGGETVIYGPDGQWKQFNRVRSLYSRFGRARIRLYDKIRGAFWAVLAALIAWQLIHWAITGFKI